MTVTLYSLEDAEGREMSYTTLDCREAKETAQTNGWLCYANEFEYSDREVTWDYTGVERSYD